MNSESYAYIFLVIAIVILGMLAYGITLISPTHSNGVAIPATTSAKMKGWALILVSLSIIGLVVLRSFYPDHYKRLVNYLFPAANSPK